MKEIAQELEHIREANEKLQRENNYIKKKYESIRDSH
jgi:FtsZ-binding cell division protein ZapB